jgi:hypothetical protein
MIELIVVEAVIGIFLLLHIIRPYVNAFREADGFTFFPVIALFCCAAMLPAYGIRPECFPLFLFTLIYNIIYFPSVTAIFSRLKNYSAHDGNMPLSFFAAALLLFSLVTAFYFTPQNDDPAVPKTQITVRDPARNIDLFVSYYQGGGNDLVMVIPPVTMPLSMIESLCFALTGTGYKVLAFSRPYFDNSAVDENGGAVELPLSQKIKRYTQTASGIKNINKIRRQRSDAAEREADIRFLLAALKTDPQLRQIVPGCDRIFLLGYGAGGAASIALSGKRDFLRAYPSVKAVAAIESVVLCDFSEREYETGKNLLQNIGGAVRRFFQKPMPRLENITHPEIPVLFLAGDGAQKKNSYSRYMAVVQTMLESESPFLFASVNGIHSIDFSTLSRKYPVLPLFFKGKNAGAKSGPWIREDTIPHTADYIAAFFSQTADGTTVARLADTLAAPEAVRLETSRSK